MSAERVKRSQYFTPPSTECPHSSRNHFEDWEEFHLPMARMHHAALHGRGVASGLEVGVQDAGTQIEVQPGVAVNGRGELIALAAEGQADIGIERPGEAGQQIDPPFRLVTAGREAGTYYLCIQFTQALRFTEGSCGKLEQTPWLRLLPTTGNAGPIEAGEAIVLAIVEIDAAGVASVRDRAEGLPHRRQLVGQETSELRLRRTATVEDAVGDQPSGQIGARDGGGLRLSVADAADAMVLEREDGGRFSRLEVQADEARLAGNLEVLGGLGLAGWRLRAGGTEADPTLDLHPLAGDRSFRVASLDGGHVPLEVHASSSGDRNAVSLALTGGRVGIGTAAPDRTLTVVGDGEAALNVRDGSGTHEVMLGIDEGGGVLSTMTEHDLQLGAGGNKSVLTLKADGRVGIGAAAPGERLEVDGRIKAGHLTVGDWPPGPNDPDLAFAFFGNNALDQTNFRNYALIQGTDGGTFLNSPVEVGLGIGGIPRMRVGSNGRIGIATQDPQATLHVAAGTDVTPSGGGFLVLGSPLGASLGFDDNEILARNRGAVSTLHLQSDGGDVWIHSKGGSATVMIKGEGRLGIGVVDPAHPIHLAGGAHCFGGREWRNGSSISCKKDVEDLPLDDALAALRELRPVTFKYIDDGEARAGFIAEEVPNLLATGDRKSLSPMEIVAVLTRVVQDQQRQIQELSERLGMGLAGSRQ
jgi:Chaperone of endosialidase